MKKLLSAVLCAVLLLTLCVAVSAEDVLYHFECEDSEITGAAKEYKDGNIQDVTIASGGKIVGLGGTNDAPQMASTVTFPERSRSTWTSCRSCTVKNSAPTS